MSSEFLTVSSLNGEKKQSKVKILFLKSSLEYYNYENTSHKLNNCSDPTVISYLSNRHTKINRRLSNNKSNAKFVTITVKKKCYRYHYREKNNNNDNALLSKPAKRA